MIKRGHFMACWMFLAAPLAAFGQATNNVAATGNPATTNSPVAVKKTSTRWDDHIHDSVSRGIVSSVHRFDSFFGEDIIDDDQYGTFVRVTAGVTLGENGKSTFDNSVSARLKFPQLQNRVQIIFDDVVEKNTERTLLSDVRDSEPLTGVRYLVSEKRTTFNLDVGVKLRINPDAFVRGRVSRIFVMNPWSLKLSEDVYWMIRNGWGEDAQARLSRKISRSMIFKATTHATWDEDHDGITYSETLALYKELSKRRATRWTIGAVLPTSPNTKTSDYFAAVTWRQLIHQNWLYLEITPTADFPVERDYEFTPLITISLDFMFGDVPDGFWQ